jgi:hypothetical protein
MRPARTGRSWRTRSLGHDRVQPIHSAITVAGISGILQQSLNLQLHSSTMEPLADRWYRDGRTERTPPLQPDVLTIEAA